MNLPAEMNRARAAQLRSEIADLTSQISLRVIMRSEKRNELRSVERGEACAVLQMPPHLSRAIEQPLSGRVMRAGEPDF